MERGTVAEAYTKLLADLDEAENILPETRSSAADRISRATKAAAIALKTRVKLHMAVYKGVIAEGTKLGTNGTGTFTSPIGGFQFAAHPYTLLVSFCYNEATIFSVAQRISPN